jgi:hypothetical protein
LLKIDYAFCFTNLVYPYLNSASRLPKYFRWRVKRFLRLK